jgi:hypothetical protein
MIIGFRPSSVTNPKEFQLDEIAQQVLDRQMRLLNMLGAIAGHGNSYVHDFIQAAAQTSKTHSAHLNPPGSINSTEHVL